MQYLFKKFSAQPFVPAAVLLTAVVTLAFATAPAPDTAEQSADPFVLAQAKADKGKASASQINPGGSGTGKGTQCPPGKKPVFVAARGKGAGTVECQ
jgi:hypothetical protein